MSSLLYAGSVLMPGEVFAQDRGKGNGNTFRIQGDRIEAAGMVDSPGIIVAANSKVKMPIEDGNNSGIVESVDSTNNTFTVAEKPILIDANTVIFSWLSLRVEKYPDLQDTPKIEKGDFVNVVVKVVSNSGGSPTNQLYAPAVLLRYPHPSKP